MLSEIRYALRQLRKSPGFAAVAIITLGLGIGINTATFAWLRATLFATLPVDAPEQIVVIWSVSPTQRLSRTASSAADLQEWRLASTSFEALEAALPASYNLSGVGPPVRAAAMRATTGFLSLMGTTAYAGRLFLQEEENPGAPRVAVLSYDFWRARFGGDGTILGHAIMLDGEPYTVIGIASQGAAVLRVDLWTPLGMDRAREDRSRRDLLVVGRLSPGATMEGAGAEMAAVAARLAQEFPDTNAGWTVRIIPLHDAFLGPDAKILWGVFTGAVAFVLLIGCANIANLLLARGLARRQEVAVRIALGAGRARVVRLFLVESLVLGIIGGILGLLIAVWVNDLLRGTVLGTIPFADRVRVDAGVLVFTSAVSIAAALAFGTLPALQASALRLQDALKAGSGSFSRSGSAYLRPMLVAGEVALATALLVIAGVFIRTGLGLVNADPGFDARNVLTARISLPELSYPTPARAVAFYEQAIARSSSVPGIASVAATSRLPLAGSVLNPNRTVEIEGRPASGQEQAWAIDLVVTPGYLRTLRIPLVSGRDFSARDGSGATPVVIVSATFASRYFGDESALGRRIRLGGADQWLEVIGVAADVRNDDLRAPAAPQLYLPHGQHPARELSFVVRTTVEPTSLGGAFADVIRSLDPSLPLYQVRTMEQVVRADVPDVPLIMGILAVCSALALLLASLGVYGVVAYSVRQQTREIAIRVTLGAKARQVVALAIGRTTAWAGLGLAGGLAAALAISRGVVRAVDFVEGIDPMGLAGTVAGLMMVTLLASWLPARHAARVDPIAALRAE